MTGICVIDYGVGNVGSILNMFRKIGADAFASGNPEDVCKSDRLLLPGVGSYDFGMVQLAERGLDVAVKDFAATGKPVMGICLGMQLLGMSSEEGELPGLGLIPFDCKRFDFATMPDAADLKVPHMGWDTVALKREDPLFVAVPEPQRYYFVHSYYVRCKCDDDVVAECEYGVTFAAAVKRGNVSGTQFHPEKSHRFGMCLMKNFAESA
ncbi:imidazole glycerol phosphate synthase subunit HisH [Gordonibacter massiliensis (ex Traore et al. 2017)]|uniref:Imidazole glycerol phosphate synthase subunit HisH n=1 Tax=Gordonibacter massiliensis (ex Traore et al. 2017) TaxID=1841863 RepID=A0A842JL50_9ACTN|nr:imidazole glycerol phosphate synthase subunit HisH [Gordonibacter massiliensis (ex Traore et al. 2017)]MBC2889919.1 imidazole glycerol phosphate synthase subunit HisH [Gordonibacter massiliensis (ex Traore et al. 2017)]